MDRFFYYTLGVMAAVLIAAFGIVFYSQNPNVLREPDSLAIDVSKQQQPSVTPTPLPMMGDPAQMASSIPIPIATPTPTPAALPWTPPDVGKVEAITYPGFTVVYSVTLGNPLAVQYAMVNNAKPKKYPEPIRVKTPDPKEITEAGFMAGPMAMPSSIALYFGKEAGRNASYMTNTSAFFPAALAGPWSQFAELEKTWAGAFGWIEVVAGPVFSNPPRQTAEGLVVPSAFYRVYRRSYGDTLAFLIPQAATSSELTEYLTSIAAVEASTGINIFSDTIMPEARGTVAEDLW